MATTYTTADGRLITSIPGEQPKFDMLFATSTTTTTTRNAAKAAVRNYNLVPIKWAEAYFPRGKMAQIGCLTMAG